MKIFDISKQITLFFSLCLVSNAAFAQRWDWASEIRGNGVNYIVDIISDTVSENIYTTGNFKDTVFFNGNEIVNPYGNQYTNIISSAFINKRNSSGQILWSHLIYGKNVKASAVTVHQGKVYATGSYQDSLFFGNDTLTTANCGAVIGLTESIYLLCLDTAGNLVYLKDYGCSAGYYPDAILVNDSGIYVSGIFNEYIFFPTDTIAPIAFPSMFLTRTDLNGNRLSTTIGAHPVAARYFYKTLLTDDSNYNIYLAGHYSMVFNFQNTSISGGNAFIAKTDASGSLLSLSDFCQSDSIVLTDVTRNNNILYYTGSIYAPTRFGADSFYVPQTGLAIQPKAFYTQRDTSLNFIKTVTPQEFGTQGTAISTDRSKNIYWNIDFDTTLTVFSTNIFNIPPQTIPKSNAVLKITNTTVRYAHLMSGNAFLARTSTVDRWGNYYVGGFAVDTMYFDTTQIILNGLAEDGFVARISCKAAAPPVFSKDTIMCWNEKMELSSFAGAGGFYSLMWFDGNDSNSVNVDSSGTYWVVKVDENGCISDTGFISIYQYPKTNITINRICDSLWVDYPVAGEWWLNGSLLQAGNSIQATQNGWFVYLNVDSNGCSTLDSIYRDKQTYLLDLSVVCDSLSAVGINNNAVIWYQNNIPVDTASYLLINESGTYYFNYTDSAGCNWSSDSIDINVSRLAPPVTYYPNPVTGNNITIKGFQAGTVQIISIDGTIEKQWEIDALNTKPHSRCKNSGQEITLYLGNISPGIHFIRINNNDNYFSGKLIISE